MTDVNLVPVDYDPFAIGAPPPAPEAQSEALGKVESGLAKQAGDYVGGMIMTPGRVAAGEVDPTSDEAVGRMADIGQVVTGGRGGVPRGALGSALGHPLDAAIEQQGRDLIGEGFRAFHGSGAHFDKFDSSMIGSGEGSQAYGYGHYVAENPEVAKSYRAENPTVNGRPYDVNDPMHQAAGLEHALGRDEAKRVAADKRMTERGPVGNGYSFWGKVYAALDSDKPLPEFKQNPGPLYEVNVKANPEHFLDWDKPLSEQGPAGEKMRALGDKYLYGDTGKMTGADVHRGIAAVEGDREATVMMRDAGIPGIKYKDQFSRGDPYFARPSGGGNYAVSGPGNISYSQDFATAQEARAAADKLNAAIPRTHNFVVFHDNLIDILKKYGLAGLIAAGAHHFTSKSGDNGS